MPGVSRSAPLSCTGHHAHQQPNGHDDDCADDVVPEKGDVGKSCHPGHRRHAGDEADEGAGTGGQRDSDGQDEDSQNRSLENRPEPVHDFDEGSEFGGPDRDSAREESPEAGDDLRDRQVVRVARDGRSQRL